MGRAPCCDKANVKKGPWSPEEDARLKNYIEQHGTGGNWIALPQKIGLKRCGKSCRLRWLNYLRPNIRHGGFSEEEDRIILSLYISIGSRWSIIAAQLPGRTDNDIKNYWNTRLKKKLFGKQSRKDHSQQARRSAMLKAAAGRSAAAESISGEPGGHVGAGAATATALASMIYPWPEQMPLLGVPTHPNGGLPAVDEAVRRMVYMAGANPLMVSDPSNVSGSSSLLYDDVSSLIISSAVTVPLINDGLALHGGASSTAFSSPPPPEMDESFHFNQVKLDDGLDCFFRDNGIGGGAGMISGMPEYAKYGEAVSILECPSSLMQEYSCILDPEPVNLIRE